MFAGGESFRQLSFPPPEILPLLNLLPNTERYQSNFHSLFYWYWRSSFVRLEKMKESKNQTMFLKLSSMCFCVIIGKIKNPINQIRYILKQKRCIFVEMVNIVNDCERIQLSALIKNNKLGKTETLKNFLFLCLFQIIDFVND